MSLRGEDGWSLEYGLEQWRMLHSVVPGHFSHYSPRAVTCENELYYLVQLSPDALKILSPR